MSEPNLTTTKSYDDTTQANNIQFIIKQFLGKCCFVSIVVVNLVNTTTQKMTVTPLVHQLAGNNTILENGPIYNVPYFRLQCGTSAVIMDPEVGDIGVAVVADKDISNVKATKTAAAPGSNRQHSYSDAMYFGGLLNQTPIQVIEFLLSGITINSPGTVTIIAPNSVINSTESCAINSPTIVLNGAVSQGSGSYAGNAQFGGTITATGEVTGNGKHLSTHVHSGVQSGSDDSGEPV